MIDQLKGLDLSYTRGTKRVLDSASLAVSAGEVVALLGVNGAGKTTLLRILLGLAAPGSGQVSLRGKPLRSYTRRAIAREMAYIPQGHVGVFPYTVRQVVALGRIPHLGMGQRPGPHDFGVIDAAIDRFMLNDLAYRPYTALSQGERQRVLAARALAQQPQILVMDEPLSGLDLGHQRHMLEVIRELASDGISILLTLHRPEDAFVVADRVALLAEGRIIADGRPCTELNSTTVSALYRTRVKQIDSGQHRFFVAKGRLEE